VKVQTRATASGEHGRHGRPAPSLQNTRALRAASIDSTTHIANGIRTNLFSDPEITSIYMNGLSGVDTLNDMERERFRLQV